MPAIAVREKRMSVRGLDGIALRVNNLDVMHQFYEEVIGLPQPWIPHRQGRMNEPSRGSEKVGLFPWDKFREEAGGGMRKHPITTAAKER